ncbi:alcohol dehydrogenase [Paucibacter oligotrophus]|uniref:Alcohol dehydrogenase n=1 Tax=Roseateles oligotrophus TaxID=1769250 RepID=A0A840LHZ5_9BURK|nr:iron-containing alcohol dehydrogenase [Roseateles oligotrophus]MBB4846242.1 alcohol dehydrogenase [Roseateles oligotrophus]
MNLYGVSRSPSQILFGAGQRHALPAVVRAYGRRVFICSDKRLRQDPALVALANSLEMAGIMVAIYEGTIAELPISCIQEAAALAKAFNPDVIIGLGGGSCMDIAKLVALLLAHPAELSNYYGEFRVPGPVRPLIAIPTTAGTGSEVTPVAVLADPARATKVGISSPYLIPVVALCDPELTRSCPKSLTAIAGADALTHAIEAFTSVRKSPTPELAQTQVFVGKNAMSDVHARVAISALAAHLAQAVEDGNDMQARAQVMYGALHAGLAFGVAGTAAAHAIQYPVGAETHTAHGAGVAALMPYVMEFNRRSRIPEFAEIARLFGVASVGDSDALLSRKAIDAVDALFQRIGIPRSLSELGLSDGQVHVVSIQAMQATRLVNNNPEALDEQAMRRIVDAAQSGDRSSLAAL